jgi:hypothetical protein
MSYDLEDWSKRNAAKIYNRVEIKIDLTVDLDFEYCYQAGNKYQGRFYVPTLIIAGKKYFVDFPYCFDYQSDLKEWDLSPVSFIKMGYYLDRKTGDPVKAHIWIKDLETGKRAAPEVYKVFIDKLRQNVIGYYYCDAEIFPDSEVRHYPADKIEFAELQ